MSARRKLVRHDEDRIFVETISSINFAIQKTQKALQYITKLKGIDERVVVVIEISSKKYEYYIDYDERGTDVNFLRRILSNELKKGRNMVVNIYTEEINLLKLKEKK